MPYFDHQMATSISDSPSDSQSSKSMGSKKDKILRTVACSNKKTEKITHKDPDASITSKYKQNIDLRKLMFMRNLLKAEIETLQKTKGALPSDNNPNYAKYSYDTNKSLQQQCASDSQFYEAQNTDYPAQPLCCQLYDSKSSGIESNSLYLRTIRHLGKKHQSIVQTWDLFINSSGNIEIFQEYCSAGNLEQFVENNTLNEKQISLYAWQLLRGLDFLGDIGISHRDIQPHNIMLRPAQKDNFLKITNFHKSIIYWNVTENDVIYVQCEPKDKQGDKNYQAPEIYGDPSKEEFDPIIADTWSYGAVIHFMGSKQYPYNVGSKSDDLDKEIADNVDKLKSLSKDGKDLLKAILKANASERMPIGLIEKSSWFNDAKRAKLKILVDKNAPVAKGGAGKVADFGKSNIFARPSEFKSTASTKKEKSSSSKKSISKSKSLSSKSKSKSKTMADNDDGEASDQEASASGAASSSSKSGKTSGKEDDEDGESGSEGDGSSGKDDEASGSQSKSGTTSKSKSKADSSSKSKSKSSASSKSGATSGEESGSEEGGGSENDGSGKDEQSGSSSAKSSAKSTSKSDASSKSKSKSSSSSKSGATSGEESGSEEGGSENDGSGKDEQSGSSAKVNI
nr:CBL-interacting protein kinase 2-like isoform X1 [Dermatophagoides farinae]